MYIVLDVLYVSCFHKVQSPLSMNTLIKSTCVTLMLLLSSNTAFSAGHRSIVKPVVVDVAQLRELAPTAQYSGLVISKHNARISSEVEGRLTWIAEVGALVEKDEVVAGLDDIFLQQQHSEELAIMQSEKAKLNLHEKEVRRYQKLIKSSHVAENLLDQAISDHSVANSNINASNARLAQIEERISRSNLRAPFAGVISERFAQSGEWTQDGDPLVRLIDIDNPEIQVRVPQAIYPLIKIDSALTVTNANQSIQAKVQTIVPVGTTTSRLFELRLKPMQPLPPGTLVRIDIPTAQSREVVSVHRDALVLRKGSITVFRVNAENTAEQIPVQVGIGDGDYVELIGDIQANDRIVTRGGERLRAGESVQISNESH